MLIVNYMLQQGKRSFLKKKKSWDEEFDRDKVYLIGKRCDVALFSSPLLSCAHNTQVGDFEFVWARLLKGLKTWKNKNLNIFKPWLSFLIFLMTRHQWAGRENIVAAHNNSFSGILQRFDSIFFFFMDILVIFTTKKTMVFNTPHPPLINLLLGCFKVVVISRRDDVPKRKQTNYRLLHFGERIRIKKGDEPVSQLFSFFF